MPIRSSSIINRTYPSNMMKPSSMFTDYDWCTTCGEKSGYGLMEICAHCHMSACDDCGSFTWGPDPNFIYRTDEEKWDKNFTGTLQLY